MVRAVVVLTGLVAAVLLWAALRPAAFRIERTVVIQASSVRLHPMISSMRQFNAWSPYVRKDPQIKGSYRGPNSGIGAAYDFEGNKEVGKGSIEVTDSEPTLRVTMALEMVEPVKGKNTMNFTLAAHGAETTEVTWEMHGANPFMVRLAGIFVDMDRLIGRDFETGLTTLKALAERS